MACIRRPQLMRIITDHPDEQELIEQVYEANQEHVFRFWNDLSETSRKKLLQQLRTIDLELLDKLFHEFILAPSPPKAHARFEPAEFVNIPHTPEELDHFREVQEAGQDALRRGRVAALLVAGGQATRLGFCGPKGVFPVSPIKGKSFFQLYAEQLKALSRKYGVVIPWYIMTSQANHHQTLDFFEKHGYFGLSTSDVFFFQQEMIAALDRNGRLVLDDRDHIFTNPNGHGGVLSALKRSGALNDMRCRGTDLIFYFQVDNILAKICDPVFLGFHIRQRAQMSAKVVSKRHADEKLGVLGKIDGRLGVIEYSDLSDADKMAQNPDGGLKFRAGNLAIHVFDLEFLEDEIKQGSRLPWHVAHKRIPFLDRAGKRIEPDTPNGYKFETFVFDAFRDAERTVILEVKRNEEFSPVKNATGLDSPETARRDLANYFAAWLERAGIPIPKDAQGNLHGAVEISPLFALNEEELKSRIPRDLTFDGELYLG